MSTVRPQLYDPRKPEVDSSNFGVATPVKSGFDISDLPVIEVLDESRTLVFDAALECPSPRPVKRRSRVRLIYLQTACYHRPSGLLLSQLDGQLTIIKESAWQSRANFYPSIRNDRSTGWDWRISLPTEIESYDKPVTLCWHRSYRQYFHFLSDVLSKVAAASTVDGLPPLYVGPTESMPHFARELMSMAVSATELTDLPQGEWIRLFGVWYPCLEYTEDMHVRPSFMHGIHNSGFWSPVLYNYCERLGHKRERSGRSRVFLSRRDAKHRRIVNYDEVESVCNRFDYVTLDPGEFSVAEQMSIFSSASAIVGVHGAGFANLLWSRPCAVVEFFPDGFSDPGYQFLCGEKNVPYSFVNTKAANMDPRPAFDGVSIDPELLSEVFSTLGHYG